MSAGFTRRLLSSRPPGALKQLPLCVRLVLILAVLPLWANGQDCAHAVFLARQCDTCEPGKFSPPPRVGSIKAGVLTTGSSRLHGIAVLGALAMITDAGDHTIVTVNITSGQTRKLAGSGVAGHQDGYVYVCMYVCMYVLCAGVRMYA